MQNIPFMKGHTYSLRLVRAVMPEGRKEILLLRRYNLLVEMNEIISAIKRIHLLSHPYHPRQPRGYRGDSVTTEDQPIGVK